MTRAVKTLSEQASDPTLKQLLTKSVDGVTRHAETLKSLIAESGDEVKKEHCLGMEGLVREALKHGVQEAPKDGELRDIEIIAQYQRMSRYGIAGFGCAAAYAKALGLGQHETKLKAIVSDIYKADEFTSQLGEKIAKLAARNAKNRGMVEGRTVRRCRSGYTEPDQQILKSEMVRLIARKHS